jgi:hypothetical protein
VHWKGSEEVIKADNFHVSDAYAPAFSEGLKRTSAQKVNLQNNHLSEKGSYSILKGLNQQVKELTLS